MADENIINPTYVITDVDGDMAMGLSDGRFYVGEEINSAHSAEYMKAAHMSEIRLAQREQFIRIMENEVDIEFGDDTAGKAVVGQILTNLQARGDDIT